MRTLGGKIHDAIDAAVKAGRHEEDRAVLTRPQPVYSGVLNSEI
jgi:hypothetical protein